VQATGGIFRGVMLAGVVLSVCVPGNASGQLARRTSNEKLLALAPIPGDGVDTAFAVAVGDALRDRLISRYRMRIGIIPSSTICEALEASGFDCKKPLPASNASALARFLQATTYMVNWLDKVGDSLQLRMRLVDAAGSGLAGWERVRVPASATAEDVGRAAGDALENQLRAAEFARDCTERRQHGDPKGALDRANKAFALYPNQPAAAMCVAYAFELQKAPIDSIVSALRRAVTGDSLNGNAWEELGRRLREAGDTTGALDAFYNQLKAEPADGRLRLGVAAGFTARKDYAKAVEVLDEGLAMNPGDMPMLQLKERACLDGGLWKCGLEALQAEYDLDPKLASDTVFFQKTFGAAQSVPDTAAMERWSRLAVEKFPEYVPAWRARAATLKLVSDRTGAIDAYQHIVALDSSQVGSALAVAQYMFDSTLVIDTVMPLDTARLLEGERMLDLVVEQSARDTATLMAVAGMFYNPASKITQMQIKPALPLAARFLEKALRADVRGALRGPANFFLGLAYAFQLFEGLETLDKTKSCDLVQTKIDLAVRADSALTVGRSISPATADRLLPYLAKLQHDLPTYKVAWKCP
jgi:tetratricopeptide (TPR) repeat protein